VVSVALVAAVLMLLGDELGVMTFPVLVAGIMLAERADLPVEHRRIKASFSVTEFPLVLALFTVSLPTMAAAHLLGAALAALSFENRGSLADGGLRRCVSNLVAGAAQSVVFAAVVAALAPTSLDPTRPGDWAVVGAASAAMATSACLAHAGASLLSGDRTTARWIVGFVWPLIAVALVTAAFGLITVRLHVAQPAAAVLFAVPVAVVTTLAKALAEANRRIERSNVGADLSRAVVATSDVERALHEGLRRIIEVFGAERVSLVVADDDALAGIVVDADGSVVAAGGEDHRRLLGIDGVVIEPARIAAPVPGQAAVVVVEATPGVSGGFVERDRPTLTELAAVLADVIQQGRMIDDLRRDLRVRIEETQRDPLTGLANRRALDGWIDRPPERGCLLVADLNGFKAINDSLGHAAGDAVLVEVAARMATCLRGDDRIARLGGDEFVAFLPDAGPAVGLTVARRIIEILGGEPFAAAEGLAVGAAIGVACWPDDAATPREAMALADEAMYAAKARKDTCAVELAGR
jgi:diguanylate cyclase (GGDEF)-like protein